MDTTSTARRRTSIRSDDVRVPDIARDVARLVAACEQVRAVLPSEVSLPAGPTLAAVGAAVRRAVPGRLEAAAARALADEVDAALCRAGERAPSDARLAGLRERFRGGDLAALFDLPDVPNTTLPRLVARLRADGLDAERLVHDVVVHVSRQHLGLVHQQANRLAPRYPGYSADDLVGFGYHGLLKALRSFDPGRGFKLSTYAASRIWGEIASGVRAEHPVSKRDQQTLRKARAAEDRLLATGVVPGDEQIAAEAGLDVDVLARLRFARSTPRSIDELLAGDDDHGADSSWMVDVSDDPAAGVLATSTAGSLMAALSQLPAEDAQAVRLLIMEGRRVRDVQALLGVSERKLRRRRERGLARLRELLDADGLQPAAVDVVTVAA